MDSPLRHQNICVQLTFLALGLGLLWWFSFPRHFKRSQLKTSHVTRSAHPPGFVDGDSVRMAGQQGHGYTCSMGLKKPGCVLKPHRRGAPRGTAGKDMPLGTEQSQQSVQINHKTSVQVIHLLGVLFLRKWASQN